MGNSCISIKNKEEREAVVALLTGDTDKMRSLIKMGGSSPVKLASWSGDRRGVSDIGDIDSFQLSYAMYDALKNDEYCEKLHSQDMWNLHRELFPDMKRTPYDQFGFIIWNWMEEPGDNPYFDEEDEKEFAETEVDRRDICLANFAIQHMEKEVVELLKAGASPYFLITTPARMEAYHDKDGILQHTYFDVAPMLDVTKIHSDDYWNDFIGNNLDKDIASLPTSTLEEVVEGLFNVGACERILYLTEKYISNEARAKGEKMMQEHLGKIHPIL